MVQKPQHSRHVLSGWRTARFCERANVYHLQGRHGNRKRVILPKKKHFICQWKTQEATTHNILKKACTPSNILQNSCGFQNSSFRKSFRQPLRKLAAAAAGARLLLRVAELLSPGDHVGFSKHERISIILLQPANTSLAKQLHLGQHTRTKLRAQCGDSKDFPTYPGF